MGRKILFVVLLLAGAGLVVAAVDCPATVEPPAQRPSVGWMKTPTGPAEPKPAVEAKAADVKPPEPAAAKADEPAKPERKKRAKSEGGEATGDEIQPLVAGSEGEGGEAKPKRRKKASEPKPEDGQPAQASEGSAEPKPETASEEGSKKRAKSSEESASAEPEGIGTLTVLSDPPGAEVALDGVKIGVTPINDISVPSGPHKVKLTHPTEGTERTKKVKVRNNGSAKVNVTF